MSSINFSNAFDNEWFFVCIPDGKSLSETIDENALNNENKYIHNAFTYAVSDSDPIKVEDGHEFKATNTNSLTWRDFTDILYKNKVGEFSEWINETNNKLDEELLDVTPYKDFKINGASWPCWVQLSHEKIDLEIYPNIIVADYSLSLSDRFQNSGWYCIGVDKNQTINNVFMGFISNDNTMPYQLHRVFKLNSNHHSEYTKTQNLDTNLMTNTDVDFKDFWEDCTSQFDDVQQNPTAFWVNISKSSDQFIYDSIGSVYSNNTEVISATIYSSEERDTTTLYFNSLKVQPENYTGFKLYINSGDDKWYVYGIDNPGDNYDQFQLYLLNPTTTMNTTNTKYDDVFYIEYADNARVMRQGYRYFSIKESDNMLGKSSIHQYNHVQRNGERRDRLEFREFPVHIRYTHREHLAIGVIDNEGNIDLILENDDETKNETIKIDDTTYAISKFSVIPTDNATQFYIAADDKYLIINNGQVSMSSTVNNQQALFTVIYEDKKSLIKQDSYHLQAVKTNNEFSITATDQHYGDEAIFIMNLPATIEYSES